MKPNWENIANAHNLVLAGTVARVDGDGWKVYRVGNIVRIDIKT